MIKSKKYEGTKVICECESSVLKKYIYDMEQSKLRVYFNNDAVYDYDNVPAETFASLNLAESQGKYFTKNIAKNFNYTRVVL